MAGECEQLKACPVWDAFNSDIKLVWINSYCRGPLQQRCARLALARAEKPVPQGLLPNGTTLPR